MFSNYISIILALGLLALFLFTLWLKRNHYVSAVPRIYMAVAFFYTVWVLALIPMNFVSPDKKWLLFILDTITNISSNFMPPLCLMIAIAFVGGWDTLPKKFYWLFLVPCISVLVIATNPLHGLYYANFSVIRSEIEFGPYILVSGGYNYLCMITGAVMMVRFMASSPTKLYMNLGITYILGVAIPFVVSLVATLGLANMSIAATPLSFIATLFFHGIAIYELHMLDIQPIATQHVLDSISDCYLVLSDRGLVLSQNQPFKDIFGKQYNIPENVYLMDCANEADRIAKTPVYNLLTAVDACGKSKAGISYEQPVTLDAVDGGHKRLYYIAEISPLFMGDKLTGYVCMFKDITALKNSMQQLESNRTRMMEQEHLAFLGQMVGGLAHNLKTPIMSISGCASALDNLVAESLQSIDDPEVNSDDYREIYGEMDTWLIRIKDACTYMSDIITAIKGQAAHASSSEESTFVVSDLIKRSTLLMRHELLQNNCQLVSRSNLDGEIILHGDVNNLIQVLDNLISNAVYAQGQKGGGQITVSVDKEGETLKVSVADTGNGIDPRVRSRLFKEMTTSKGTQGTGLGLYISSAIVRGKFGGTMWVEDNPGGGAIFGFTIPLEHLTFDEGNASGLEGTK